MKTSISRMRDVATGELVVTVRIDSAELAGLGEYRTRFVATEIALVPTTGDDLDGEQLLPVHVPLRSEFSQLLAQVILLECINAGAVPPLRSPRHLTPARWRHSTGDPHA